MQVQLRACVCPQKQHGTLQWVWCRRLYLLRLGSEFCSQTLGQIEIHIYVFYRTATQRLVGFCITNMVWASVQCIDAGKRLLRARVAVCSTSVARRQVAAPNDSIFTAWPWAMRVVPWISQMHRAIFDSMHGLHSSSRILTGSFLAHRSA